MAALSCDVGTIAEFLDGRDAQHALRVGAVEASKLLAEVHMSWIVGALWGCINCSSSIYVSIDAEDAAGNALIVESGMLTLVDGSTRDLTCTDGVCSALLLGDEPMAQSAQVIVNRAAHEIALDDPEDGAECGMSDRQVGTVIVP